MGEFFRVKASTAQALVKEIGPFYRERDGTSLVDFEFKLSTLIGKSMMVLHIVVGRGRPQVHLQEQILMLLHFVAHKGKYGLLSDKFGITRSCYFTCIEEMMAIVTQDLLGKHIFWPNSDRQKEMCDYYKQRYGFLGVIGAIDGTHVTISKPPGMQFSEDYFSVQKKMYTMLLQVCSVSSYKILDPRKWRCKNSGPPHHSVHSV